MLHKFHLYLIIRSFGQFFGYPVHGSSSRLIFRPELDPSYNYLFSSQTKTKVKFEGSLDGDIYSKISKFLEKSKNEILVCLEELKSKKLKGKKECKVLSVGGFVYIQIWKQKKERTNNLEILSHILRATLSAISMTILIVLIRSI